MDLWLRKLEIANKKGSLPINLFREIKKNIQDAIVHDFNLIHEEFDFFDSLPSHL